MKLIIAVIQPEELPEIKEELLKRKFINSQFLMQKGKEKKFQFRKYTEVFLTR